ncbi:hypothetical protein Pla86_35880 [Planctomycetes bacterium Pla86]|uniref:Uncharacterized protein n=2 Tax=Engelhardtia mirabilis TaxID=2528011 RepID=A0A518BNC8_9BACT|nr:hypothetical protein Pla133_35900 [Planctomycetes bacterium Pla133]QDV02817.1 hypothetical protein Pla86_35880 [Planctomycetes bacterium Pla86]
MVGEFPFLGRTAGWSAPERSSLFTRTERGKTYSPRALQTLLWRMAIHDEQVGSGSIPGFELVWRTGLREGATGAPALSIWRRAREAPGDHLQRATLNPR